MVATTVTNQGFSPWFSDANRQLRMVWSVEFIAYRLWVKASRVFVFYLVGARRSGMGANLSRMCVERTSASRR
jgi:hypothetical protein